MNHAFQILLRDEANSEIAEFIRATPGQLDSDDIKAALGCLFEQLDAVKQMALQAQFAR